jgi:hypothetical protein
MLEEVLSCWTPLEPQRWILAWMVQGQLLAVVVPFPQEKHTQHDSVLAGRATLDTRENQAEYPSFCSKSQR